MSEKQIVEEKLLRFAAPALYKRMIDTFSGFHIHPYEILGTVLKNNLGFSVTLRYSNDFSQAVTIQVSLEQALHPDEEVTRFFEETAERCKSQLISDYFNFIQQKSPTS